MPMHPSPPRGDARGAYTSALATIAYIFVEIRDLIYTTQAVVDKKIVARQRD